MKEGDKVKAVLCVLASYRYKLDRYSGRSGDGIRKITFLPHIYSTIFFFVFTFH